MLADLIIYKNFEKECTGCAACQNVCPTGAISIIESTDGFLYPKIDKDVCIDCKKCQNHCPINFPNFDNYSEPKCLVVMAKDDVRLSCSSGGVFGAIAKTFLKEGGFISGAIYDEHHNVHHILSNNIDDFDRIIGSKYVQSDTSNVYTAIKRKLQEGHKILFCGCPCQVAGLYSVVGFDNTNLYTMDLICHGVPSYKFYRRYLERYGEIESIDFRDKSVFGWSTEINITKKTGERINKRHEKDTFYKAFLPCMVQRESCSRCKFSVLPRQGDLTIGDYWGIDRYDPNLNDKKGTSVVLVNNEKGQNLIESHRRNFTIINETPIEFATRINSNILKPLKAHFSRTRFFKDFDITSDLDKLVDDCLKSHYDVGIVGLWYGLNFGSILTYYALYELINNLGYNALMINKPKFVWTDRYENENTIAQRFIRKKCNVSLVRNNEDDLKTLSNHCDAFIVGSDVVWNYEISGKTSGQFFFLDFVNDKCKKIAFASSFGRGYSAPEKEHILSTHYLHKFDYISVREEEAKKICKEIFEVNADIVLDPVFLCSYQKYDNIANESNIRWPESYLGTYILGPDILKNKMLTEIQESLKIPTRIIPNPNNEKAIERLEWENSSEIIYNGEVEDFLACVRSCKYFLADSFHGTCFAIIMKKQFIAVTGKNQSDNCRFIQLLSTIGLLDRLIFLEDYVENDRMLVKKIKEPINYNEVYKILNTLIPDSISWLNRAFKNKKKSKYSLSDLLIEDLKRNNNKIEKCEADNTQLRNILGEISVKMKEYIPSIYSNAHLFLNNVPNLKDKLIVISVKDTMGHDITEEMMKFLKELEVKTNCRNQHWKGFIAIVYKNCVIEHLGKFGEVVGLSKDVVIESNCLNIDVLSAPYNSINTSAILINGKDYSNDKRGFNIVVYDVNKNQVIDSVTIDTHSKPTGFSRKMEYGT